MECESACSRSRSNYWPCSWNVPGNWSREKRFARSSGRRTRLSTSITVWELPSTRFARSSMTQPPSLALWRPCPATDTDFIAAVAPVDPGQPVPEPARIPHRSRTFYSVMGGCIAVVLLVGALVAWNFHGWRQRLLAKLDAPPPVRSVAVLPLLNLSSDPEQQFFADGMTDELITSSCTDQLASRDIANLCNGLLGNSQACCPNRPRTRG